MKIILFRSNNIFDSRVNKYHNYYERKNIDYTIVGWDRDGKHPTKDKYEFYKFKSGYAVGGMKAVVNHFKWMIFVLKYLLKHKNVTTIHACDLNSAFPAAVYKVFFKRKVVLIFDACDWFSSNFAHRKYLKKVFEWMEKFTYRLSDELIICEKERIEQIQFKLNKQPLILPNIPEVDDSIISQDIDQYKFDNQWPTLAYLGGFSDNRFLLELLELAESEKFNLLIAGYGDKIILTKCEKIADLNNVKYFGRLNMKDGLSMEYAADVIYAMYCKTNPNNIYAAPNKYYEALFLGKPLISTKGTIVEPKVEDNHIGWTIEEDIEELRSLVRDLNRAEIKDKGNNARHLWEKNFKDYVRRFFDEKYEKIIK